MIQQRKCKKKKKTVPYLDESPLVGKSLIRGVSSAHLLPCMYLLGMFVRNERGMRTGRAVLVDEELFSLVGMKIDLMDASDQCRKY